MHCLVIGATGYVGARLVPRLLAEGRKLAEWHAEAGPFTGARDIRAARDDVATALAATA